MLKEKVLALGLMSGTSLDGIDAALIETDGERVNAFGPWLTLPYTDAFRGQLRGALRGEGDIPALERDLTLRHAEVVEVLLQKAGAAARDVRVIGFHGQTLAHRPQEGITWQIGNGALLAERTGIDVVCDFRRADVAAGGQGAPLVPLFHAALASDLPKPCAILNIGGVANVTWIGEGGAVIAFDTGPGNALINDAAHKASGAAHDEDGKLAARGKVDSALLARLLRDPFFATQPPKSLDRDHFSGAVPAGLSHADAAATLTEFTAASVEAAAEHFPHAPKAWFVCGGGRHNPVLMAALARRLGNVQSVGTLGWAGDALEAQAFAFLAVRSLRGLPLSMPSTTGVTRPVSGGVVYRKSL